MSKPTRWSYSSVIAYESCPAKWKYAYIDKKETEPTAAMERGTRLHADCENFLKGTLMALPWELKKASLRINDIKTAGAKAEETWLLNKDWAPLQPGEEPWIKAIIDAHWVANGTLYVRDWKTGREYASHRDQLELYALMGLHIYPTAKRAEYAAVYLDSNHTAHEGSVLRGDMLEKKRADWTARAIRIFEDEQYLPRPGGQCKFCDYSHLKDGPCLAG